METKNVLKTLVKLFFAAPLLTVSITSIALESFDLAKEDTSAPIPTTDDQSETKETNAIAYPLKISAAPADNSEEDNSEEGNDSDYQLKVSANDETENGESEENGEKEYNLQLSANDNDNPEESDSDDDQKRNT